MQNFEKANTYGILVTKLFLKTGRHIAINKLKNKLVKLAFNFNIIRSCDGWRGGEGFVYAFLCSVRPRSGAYEALKRGIISF